MSLLLAFPSLSTSTMAYVASCPLPAALAALSDTPCLQSVPTTSIRTSSSRGDGAEHEHDDQQEQRQDAHRHHPGSDNGDIAINNTGLLQDNMEPTLTRAWHFHSKVDQNLTAQIDSEGPRGPRVDCCEKKSRLGLGAGNKGFFNFLLRVSQQSAHEAQAQPGSNEVRHAWSKLVPEVPCPARAA